MTKTGPEAVGNLNPYEEQQAETMSTSGGVSYEHFTNIVKVPSISSLGNDASKNLQVKMNEGAWTMVRNADFGTQGATKLTIRAKGTGTLEVRLGGKAAATAARLEFSSKTVEEHSVELDPMLFQGVKRIFFVFTEVSTTSSVLFDSWQFFNEKSTGVSSPHTSNLTPRGSNLYDLKGQRRAHPVKGLNISHGRVFIKK
jgi:arabinoxylan arabinofuranohydrolase